MTLASRLPAYTWDRIAPLREKACAHPDGAVDLSIGTPVARTLDVLEVLLLVAVEGHVDRVEGHEGRQRGLPVGHEVAAGH